MKERKERNERKSFTVNSALSFLLLKEMKVMKDMKERKERNERKERKKYPNPTTLLKKSPNKYDTIRTTSNTFRWYKTSGFNHYTKRIMDVCNRTDEARGSWALCTSYCLTKATHPDPSKTWSVANVTTQLLVSNIHISIKRLLKECHFPQAEFYYPVDVPQRKLRDFIFTKKKMTKKLWMKWHHFSVSKPYFPFLNIFSDETGTII